jgi:small subunit ribosomal protein S6
MKRYEVMYIIRPNLEYGVRTALIEEFNKILNNYNSKITKVDEWGLKDLAYEIKDCKKGYYVVLDVESDIEAVNELDRVMSIRENVLRHIVIARDEQ